MKKILFILVAVLLFIPFTHAQSRDIITVWPNNVPGEKNAKSEARLLADTSKNVSRLTDVTNPILEGFYPKKEKSNGQAIVICPGGSYKLLAIDLEGYEIAEWLTTLGYTAFVLQYRVPNKKGGALQDIQRSLRIVRSKGYKKIGVMGFSAGGNLSARASTRFNELTYPKQDEVDELSCCPDFTILIYPAYLNKGENGSLTPELTISDQISPTFMFVAADDRCSRGTLVMAMALRNNSTPVELHLVPKGGHGYGMRKGNPAAETWPELLNKWLQGLNY